jgi:hypothetical protein
MAQPPLVCVDEERFLPYNLASLTLEPLLPHPRPHSHHPPLPVPLPSPHSLSDYLERVRESDRVLLRSNLDKVGLEDLLDACSQRAVSLGDLSPGAMRKNLRAYLNTVSRPPVRSPKGDQELNDSNLRFALLGFNMANLVRDAQENSGLRALFGCR